MGRKNHNPSIARRILRDLKNGESPSVLISEARRISDPYYSTLGLTYIASTSGCDNASKIFKEIFSKIDDVRENWRRIELIGKISKRLKALQNVDLQKMQFDQLLKCVMSEGKADAKDFIVKHARDFPSSFLENLLLTALKLKGYEFEASKAVIRAGVASPEIIVKVLSNSSQELRTKLLGYLHFQMNKSKISSDSSPLEIAASYANTEETWKYLVRVCSSPEDLVLIRSSLPRNSPEQTIPILISLIARADRKGWSKDANQLVVASTELISKMPSKDLKSKFEVKLQATVDRLSRTIPEKRQSARVPMTDIPRSGNNTLALYNTYDGKWNHPHYKAVFKAANLCSAFDLNLALIGFPEIEGKKIASEIKKEMRLPNEGYFSQLLLYNRVKFFEKDVDESWAGTKIITTENPDSKKLGKPEGKICMIMGLGPKGLPDKFIEASDNHFEITGSGVGLETGTAMGAIAAHLSLQN